MKVRWDIIRNSTLDAVVTVTAEAERESPRPRWTIGIKTGRGWIEELVDSDFAKWVIEHRPDEVTP